MQEFQLSLSKTAKQNKFWKTQKYTLEQLSGVFQHEVSAQKDGWCFVPGALAGGERKNTAVTQVDFLVYDIDCDMTVEALDAKLDILGTYAIMYTTYSHKTTTTLVATSAYLKEADAKRWPRTPTLESMTAYLKEKGKDHLRNIQFDAKQGVLHGGDGMMWEVKHDPVDKMRIVFPLKTPIVLSQLDVVTSQALAIYTSIYKGIGDAIGLPFDPSCADAARLHYMPMHKEHADHRAVLYDGPLLDWEKYPRAAMPTAGRKGVGNSDFDPANYRVLDRDQHLIDLAKWDMKNRDSFDLEDMLLRVLPEGSDGVKKSRDAGGYVICCPFEEEHTTPGGEGTYAVNASDEYPWTIYCSHASCKDVKGRRRLDYLKRLIETGFVTRADLGIVEYDQQAVKNAAEAAGIDSSLLPSNLGMEAEDDAEPDAETDSFLNTDFSDAAEARKACFTAIKMTKAAKQAVTAFMHLVTRKIEFNDQEIVELLAESPMSIPAIRKFGKQVETKMDMFEGDITEAVKDQRISKRPIAQAVVDEVINADYVSEDAVAELRRLAGWYGADIKTVRRAYDELRKDSLDQNVQPQLLKHLREMDRQFGRVQMGKDTMFIHIDKTREKSTPVYLTHSSMKTRFSNHNVSVSMPNNKGGASMVKVNVFKYWNENWPDIRNFNGFTFNPKDPSVTDHEGNLNLFNGIKMKPLEGDPSPVTDHVRRVWCNDDEKLYNWLTYWLADIFQNPGAKPHTAVAILGGAGTGKSIICEYGLGRMLAPYYGKSPRKDILAGKFNAHMSGKLLWLGEEALFVGDKQSMEVLKDSISSEQMQVEPKGRDSFQLPNYCRFLFTSNNPHALLLDSDDRRFCVIRTNDAEKQKTEYFSKLRAWLNEDDNKGCRIWLNHLMKFKPEDYGLTRNDLYTPPMTEWKQEQITMSRDASEEFFFDIIKNGRMTNLSVEKMSAKPQIKWPLHDELMIKQEDFTDHYHHYLAAWGAAGGRYDRMKLSSHFGRFIGVPYKEASTVRKEHGKSVRFIRLPKRIAVMEKLVGTSDLSPDDIKAAIEHPDSHETPFDQEA
jgi:hypothetical protein